jgi:hypothetical protein
MRELSLDISKRYTYADYLTWLDDQARELINGFIKMLPAPRLEHAEVSSNVSWHLRTIVGKKKSRCKVFTAPFDVRFPKQGEKLPMKALIRLFSLIFALSAIAENN